jgi:cytochrome c oxidase subunit 1
MPRRYYSYPERHQWLHVLSTAGASVLALGLLLVVAYLGVACFRGERAGPNPWGSAAPEWRVPSPPPTHNFVEPPAADDPYDYDGREPHHG